MVSSVVSSPTDPRSFLIWQSLKKDQQVDRDLCAYNPTEALKLLQNPRVQRWQKLIALSPPPGLKRENRLVLFPAASQKPWSRPSPSQSYQALYRIMDALESRIPISSLSETLAVVPEHLYDEMPHYDNPGLYRWFVKENDLAWNPDHHEHAMAILNRTVEKILATWGAFRGDLEVHAIVRRGSTHQKMMKDVRPAHCEITTWDVRRPFWTRDGALELEAILTAIC